MFEKLLTSLDLAVEFATLGEYRLVDPYLVSPSTTDFGRTRPERRLIELADVDRGLLPRPSTALARATAPAGAAVVSPSARRAAVAPPPATCEVRRRGDAPDAVRRPQRRARGGSVQPAAQLCLLVD